MKQLATIELLEKMMTHCPVTADVEAVNHLVAFLAGYLSDNQVGVKTHRSGDRSVLYAGSLEVSPDYLFNAHLDVVPAPAEMFRLQRRGNQEMPKGC